MIDRIIYLSPQYDGSHLRGRQRSQPPASRSWRLYEPEAVEAYAPEGELKVMIMGA